MEPITIGLLGLAGLMFMLFFTRMPVGFAMALVGFCGFAAVVNPRAAMSSMTSSLWEVFSSYGLAVIPFFIFMGNICFSAGVSNRLYKTAYTWSGQIKGGISMATVLACAGFAAICGSNAATAATMSAVALPEMKKFGYHPALSTGSVACGSTLGVVIPPSVVLIVIGLSTGESIAKLFFASLIPGLLLMALFILTVYLLCLRNPELGPKGPKTTFREKLRSLPGSIEMLILFALIMAGLYLGWFTATEAGAAGAFFSIVISVAGRHLTWKKFLSAVKDSVVMSCMIMMIVGGAVIFGRFLTVTRLPFEAADWVAALPIPSVVVLLLMLTIYLVGGALMDALGLLMITIPIFFPVALRLGYDPLWFAVVITVITTMGAVTPPVGVNTYVVAAMAPDVEIGTVFRGVSWFMAAFVACIGLLIFFPAMATWLPALLG
ncbi:TRAP transporter large permease [Desulfuromonas sp. TF]|uniref:TRAP transporter large permease n=1 Tax=Desulfuromonas sp. TF TaxID=1232410 RepID=UPI000423CB53|nr:TRAP transporter large permease [Desulfuromonas sp. TF]